MSPRDDLGFDRPPDSSSEDEAPVDLSLLIDSSTAGNASRTTTKRPLQAAATRQSRAKRRRFNFVGSDDGSSEEDETRSPTQGDQNEMCQVQAKPQPSSAPPPRIHSQLSSTDSVWTWSQPSQRKKKAVYSSKSRQLSSTPIPNPDIDIAPVDGAELETKRAAQPVQPDLLLEVRQRSPDAAVDLRLDLLREDDETQNMSNFTEPSNSGTHNSCSVPGRRDSMSSLSSADSFAELVLSKAQKDALSSETTFCPHCSCPLGDTSARRIDSSTIHLRGAAVKDFCHLHELDDAVQQCEEKGYPQRLEVALRADRVQRHIRNMKSLIERKQDSYYLQKLDEAISEARGNQTRIHRYIQETSVENIHYGYYGPEGVLKLTSMINADVDVEKWLKKAKGRDKSLKAAGGDTRIVSCVLLPEVLTSLVMEDMNLNASKNRAQSAEEARRILRDSASTGFVLHPDETTVSVDSETIQAD